MAVFSRAPGRPIKTANFDAAYSDWKFVRPVEPGADAASSLFSKRTRP